MYPIDRVRERYRNDPVFHGYVDTMRMCIKELHLDPSELREAAMLASIMESEQELSAFTVKVLTDAELDQWKKGPYR